MQPPQPTERASAAARPSRCREANMPSPARAAWRTCRHPPWKSRKRSTIPCHRASPAWVCSLTPGLRRHPARRHARICSRQRRPIHETLHEDLTVTETLPSTSCSRTRRSRRWSATQRCATRRAWSDAAHEAFARTSLPRRISYVLVCSSGSSGPTEGASGRLCCDRAGSRSASTMAPVTPSPSPPGRGPFPSNIPASRIVFRHEQPFANVFLESRRFLGRAGRDCFPAVDELPEHFSASAMVSVRCLHPANILPSATRP